MDAKLRVQNKTLIKINSSYLLITLGWTHINELVVSTQEIPDALIAYYVLVHGNELVVSIYEIHQIHVTSNKQTNKQ